MKARILNFVLIQRVEPSLLCKRKARYCDLFCLLFSSLFSFSICHSNVRHREICVKDFTRTIRPGILKVYTNTGFDLYCVRENQPSPAYHSLYLSSFPLSHKNPQQMSHLVLEPIMKTCLYNIDSLNPPFI